MTVAFTCQKLKVQRWDLMRVPWINNPSEGQLYLLVGEPSLVWGCS